MILKTFWASSLYLIYVNSEVDAYWSGIASCTGNSETINSEKLHIDKNTDYVQMLFVNWENSSIISSPWLYIPYIYTIYHVLLRTSVFTQYQVWKESCKTLGSLVDVDSSQNKNTIKPPSGKWQSVKSIVPE